MCGRFVSSEVTWCKNCKIWVADGIPPVLKRNQSNKIKSCGKDCKCHKPPTGEAVSGQTLRDLRRLLEEAGDRRALECLLAVSSEFDLMSKKNKELRAALEKVLETVESEWWTIYDVTQDRISDVLERAHDEWVNVYRGIEDDLKDLRS
jgi:hypothetical protein